MECTVIPLFTSVLYNSGYARLFTAGHTPGLFIPDTLRGMNKLHGNIVPM
jgi:hypothetical protein